jgi:Zn-dependent alcohol dehydrogenase
MQQARYPRRNFIRNLAAAAAGAAVLPACSRKGGPWRFFTEAEARLVDAIAEQIVPADRDPGAIQAGATHFIDASSVDVNEAVKEIVPDGVDVSFECVGHPALIRQSIDLLDWGGTAVILGVPKFGTEASFLVSGMYNDKTIMGCRYGAGRPHKDIPLFVDLYLAGRLKLDELVTKTYALEDIDQTIEDMHNGDLARGVLTF